MDLQYTSIGAKEPDIFMALRADILTQTGQHHYPHTYGDIYSKISQKQISHGTTTSSFSAKNVHILTAMPVLKPQVHQTNRCCLYILRGPVSLTQGLLTALLPYLQGSMVNVSAGLKAAGCTLEETSFSLNSVWSRGKSDGYCTCI